jgi:hypothetical protein
LHQEHFYFSLIRVWVNAHNLITARVCEDPEAEVIALSPRTLVATNRFVCEICNKGFQRDQNLQLHRRGHNLPWKLRQRTPSAGGRQGDAAAQARVRLPGAHLHPPRLDKVFKLAFAKIDRAT